MYTRGLACLRCRAPRAAPPPSRGLVTGRATAAGTSAYASRNAGLVPRRTMPRTGWPLPALAFGDDDRGTPGEERLALLAAAVSRRGVNAVVLDGDALLARRIAGSDNFVPHAGVARDWEFHALRRLLGGDDDGALRASAAAAAAASAAVAAATAAAAGVRDRSELIIMARLSIGACRFGTRALVGVADLPHRVAALLVALDLACLDVLHVDLPASRSAWGDAQTATLLTACEELVASGHIAYYGLACDAFSAAEGSGAGEGRSGGAPLLAAGQPLRPLLNAAEALRGHAAARRAQLRVHCGTDEPFVLGNAMARPDVGQQRDRADAAPVPGSRVEPPPTPPAQRPHPDPEGHHLVALTYALSPTRPSAVLPAIVDAGGTPFCVADLARRYGVTQFVRAPLDVVVRVPAAGTLAQSGLEDADDDDDAASAELTDRTFRCVCPPPHLDAHPARLTPVLNDVINYAIHLELLWDNGGVKDDVAAAHASGGRRAGGAGPSGGAGEQQEGAAAGAGAGGGAAAGESATPTQSRRASAPLQAPTSPNHPATRLLLASLFPPVGAARGDASRAAAPAPLADLRPGDVAWARSLGSRFDRLDNFAEWVSLRDTRLLPALGRVRAAVRGVESVLEWHSAYEQLMTRLVRCLDIMLEQAQHARAGAVAAALDAGIPELPQALARAAVPPTLTARILTLALSCPVDCVATEVPDAFALKKNASGSRGGGESSGGKGGRGGGGDAVAAEAGAAHDDADAAAAAARLAARAAEIDAFIAEARRGGSAEALSEQPLSERPSAPAAAAPLSPSLPAPPAPQRAAKPRQPCAVEPRLFDEPDAFAVPLAATQAAFARRELSSSFARAAASSLPKWSDPLLGTPVPANLAPLQAAVRRAHAAAQRRLGPGE